MSKQIIYNEQKMWVLRDSNCRLRFFTKDCNLSKNSNKTPFWYHFFVDNVDFMPFIKSCDTPSLFVFRAVNVYNFKLRANVERGIATRDKYGTLVFKSVSSKKQKNLLIYNPNFLPVITKGTLHNVEIIKLRK